MEEMLAQLRTIDPAYQVKEGPTILGKEFRRSARVMINGLSRGVRINVKFFGTQALTNGTTIILPKIKDLAEIKYSTARSLMGYAIHEAAHIRYTDFKAIERIYDDPAIVAAFETDDKREIVMRLKLIKNFENCIEDYRIENRMIRDYPGTKSDLGSLRKAIHPPLSRFTTKWLSDPRSCGPLALTWTGGRLNGYSNPHLQRTLDGIPAPVLELIEDWTDRMRDVTDTTHVVDLAIAFEQEAQAYVRRVRQLQAEEAAAQAASEERRNEADPEDRSATDHETHDDTVDDEDLEGHGNPDPAADGPEEVPEDDDFDATSRDDGDEPERPDAGEARSNDADDASVGDSDQPRESDSAEEGDEGSEAEGTSSSGPRDPQCSDDRSEAPDQNGRKHEEGVDRISFDDGRSGAQRGSDPKRDGRGRPMRPARPDEEGTIDMTRDLLDEYAGDAPASDNPGDDVPSDREKDAIEEIEREHDQDAIPKGDDSAIDESTPEQDDLSSFSDKMDDPASSSTDGDHSSPSGRSDHGEPVPRGPDGQVGGNPGDDHDSTDPDDGEAEGGEAFRDLYEDDALQEDAAMNAYEDLQDRMRGGEELPEATPEPSAGELDPSAVIDAVNAVDEDAPNYDSSDQDVDPQDLPEQTSRANLAKRHYGDARFSYAPAGGSDGSRINDLMEKGRGLISTTARTIRRLLMSEEKSGVLTNRRSGEFDIRNLSAIIRNTGTCYRRTWRKPSPRTLLVTLIDFSYSMRGWSEKDALALENPVSIAMAAALAIEEAVKGTPVNSAIYGYTGVSPTVKLHVFKEGEESANDVRRRIGGFERIEMNATPTGEAMAAVALRMDEAEEERRILLVLTDGEADDVALCSDVVRVLGRRGIEVVVIGIKNDSGEAWAPVHRTIDDVGQIPAALLDTIDPRAQKKARRMAA